MSTILMAAAPPKAAPSLSAQGPVPAPALDGVAAALAAAFPVETGVPEPLAAILHRIDQAPMPR
ncbi:hypothetical protein [Sphingomonas sp.]|uniref:hypothetical protein n=1 Tax=Sphingomonas sp. TaxID=28214 RepID=UPI001D5CADD6|nr:hypothetical protein [Sphingomonas sp.]MBX9797060.1 hypothetical protein [Sphingomonas sp.]